MRIEDAIATLGTIISERCIELAGDISIYDHNKVPGQRIFSDNINIVIFGDSVSENIEQFPADSVVGQMRDTLKTTSIGLEHFPSMKTVLENFAAGIGEEEDWGKCPWTVPDDNKPSVLPLRVGFETRYTVDHIIQTVTNKNDRLKICIQALCKFLVMTKDAIDPSIALLISFETINGMSKTAPMTVKRMNEL